MFSITINDETTFSNFLNSTDLDYLDVYLHDTSATFIANNNDLFSVYMCECIHTPNESSRSFRMPRSMLKQQKNANVLSIRFDDGFVYSSFAHESALLCEAKFVQQKAYSFSYESKLKLLKGKLVPSSLKLDTINKLTKLCLTLNGVLNIESGVVCAVFSNGIRIYKSIKFDDCLCISPKYVRTLALCDDSIFSIENYVGAYKNNFAVLASQSRVTSNQQYGMLKTARSQYAADIDFSNLAIFACSHPVKTAEFVIDLDAKYCNFIEHDISYKIPVKITNEQRSKNDTVHELHIPFSIVRNMLPTIGETSVHLEQKQFFAALYLKDYTIIFN